MAGINTNGLPVYAQPLTGAETAPFDTNLPAGEGPQSVSISTALLGVSTVAGGFAIAYAATTAMSGLNGSVQALGAMTGASTLTLSNFTPGVTYRLKVTQDGTGSRALTVAGATGAVKISGSQSTTASYIDWLTIWFDGTNYWAFWNVHFV